MASELVPYSTQVPNAAAVDSALDNAVSIITKNYLDRLESYEIVSPSKEVLETDITKISNFYKLTKLVLNKEENFLNKLTTIVNVVSSIGCSLSTIIKSDGKNVDFYLGTITKDSRNAESRQRSNSLAFRGAVLGNLIGSEIHEISVKEMEDLRVHLAESENRSISSVSGVVAMRNRDALDVSGYVQGIENLVDSLKGQKYTIVMIADPVASSEIQQIKTGYETLYTQLSTFARNVVTLSENDTASLSSAKTEGIARGIAEGVAMTQSRTRSVGKTRGFNANVGFALGAFVSVGYQGSTTRSTADTSGRTDSKIESKTLNQSSTSTVSTSKMSGKSLQLSSENRSVKSLLDKIDKHLVRLDECDSFGAFDCAAYVIAEDKNTALTVAGNYNALMRGTDSSVQSSHINLWSDMESAQKISQYVSAMYHPRFYQDDNRVATDTTKTASRFASKQKESVVVTPATIISGNELSMQIGLPKKSITGVTVIPMAPFGRNVSVTGGDNLTLGSLYHMGQEEVNGKTVDIDIQSLASHTLITGTTGAGKTTAISFILDKLSEKGIKFLVVEPVKGEYKNKFGSRSDVFVYGTNAAKMPLLKINPFSFPEDIHVLEHIDRLIEIFNVCWPLYAAMPAILKDAIERAYRAAGWNLETSKCRHSDVFEKPLFPTFIDVLNQVHSVMDDSLYSAESKGDYKGALCTRIRSLTNGLYGQIFGSDEIAPEKLFDQNVIIDLSRTGSSETKSLIMGLLVMKLQEYRMTESANHNSQLQHITVLEEAHHILKRGNNTEHATLTSKSVEMLANAIAEMRAYGEGFIVADQSPGLLDLSVIRNTNTKILLRLPDLGDRELVGRASNLNEEQILELSRLKTFVAAVYQNDWLEPVLCHINHDFENAIVPYTYCDNSNNEMTNTNGLEPKQRLLRYLLMPESAASLYVDQVKELLECVLQLPIPMESKIAFATFTQEKDPSMRKALRGQILYHLLDARQIFVFAKNERGDIIEWYRCVLDNLEPNVAFLEDSEQKTLISILLHEEIKCNGSQGYQELMAKWVEYVDSK